jgi:pilus assembly protein CpaC
MQVNGSQNIAIKVKIYEVARDKLREIGVDWSLVGPDFNIISSVSDLISNIGGTVASTDANVTASVIGDSTRLNAAIRFLEDRSIARLLDEPVLVAQNGRPAEFLSGGELPIPLAAGLGAVNVEFRAFGTKLDIVPLVHGQGLMSLEVRAEVSEIAQELAVAGVPGLRIRRVNTGVRMRAGHTLALAGDYADRSDNSIRGVPKLMDNPVFGPLFRRTNSRTRENELVFLITPQFVNDIDASLVNDATRPGKNSADPSDHELFINGHLEVPACGEDCQVDDSFRNGPSHGSYMQQPVGGNGPANNPHFVPGIDNQIGHTQSSVPHGTTANADFQSSFNFPSDGSSRRASSNVADAESSGFLWPNGSKTR